MGENYISCSVETGSINISEDVISTIVRNTASEVEGVAALSNTAGAEIAEMIGLKTVSKGVKVQFVDETIVVDIILSIAYGRNIVKVATAVQDKVLSVLQSTTGIDKLQVNVHVAGIAFEK
jgi:uncharacterized alkaline shock family protein YloU